MLTFLLSPVIGGLERSVSEEFLQSFLSSSLRFLLATIGWITALQFTSLAKELPKYQGNIKQKIADVRAAGKGGNWKRCKKLSRRSKKRFRRLRSPQRSKQNPRPVVVEAEQSATFWPVPIAIGPLVERLASAGLAIVLVIFMLIRRGRSTRPTDPSGRLQLHDGYHQGARVAGERISRYLLMQSIINSFLVWRLALCFS